VQLALETVFEMALCAAALPAFASALVLFMLLAPPIAATAGPAAIRVRRIVSVRTTFIWFPLVGGATLWFPLVCGAIFHYKFTLMLLVSVTRSDLEKGATSHFKMGQRPWKQASTQYRKKNVLRTENK
jgi:hypothetical protein